MSPHPHLLVLEPTSPSWPRRLEQIDAPPERLWVRGRSDLLGLAPLVALVGTRAPTPYGEAQAARFARALACEGVGVVSGLARGIDQAAHLAALEVGGPTLAVLGCGVDRPWPAGELADRLAAEGALISELEPGTPPRRHHFPRRNRLISGLAEAVVVVEAAFASGSLITARWAADQGRTVLAIPGRVDHPMARGCHRLLREGALLAEDPEDVLRELGRAAPSRSGGTDVQPLLPGAESEPLLAVLQGETLSCDELAERTGRSVPDLLTRLVQLELAGAVARVPGGLYRRI